MLDKRYIRNIGAITPQEQEMLKNRRVCLAGCGGLGGFLAEYLGRLGVGHLTAVDPDCFDASNLNRQLLSDTENLGTFKAEAVKIRMARVNPGIPVEAVTARLTQANAAEILAGHDLVLDGLDSISDRLMLQRLCKELDIPLVHGAVDGWYGQITTVLPGDDTLSRLYPGEAPVTGKASPSVLPFVPAFVASVQASEAAKLLLGRTPSLRGQMLFADLLRDSFDLLPL